MWTNLRQLLNSYELYEVVIEWAVIGLCVYAVVRFLRGTRGAGVIKGVAVLLVVLTLLIRVLGQSTDAFSRLNFIYDRFLGLLAILLIVVFQPELRQAMVRIGHARLFGFARHSRGHVIDAVADAVDLLSKQQVGALIAIERDVKLGGLVAGGEQIDAQVSARLLSTIFWPNSPLHDLGVVIRGDRILAANVQFPLAEDIVLPMHYGSRHRAAVGVTMESDCLTVVVSEETGRVALAEAGRIDPDIPRERLREILRRRLDIDREITESADTTTVEESASTATSERASTTAVAESDQAAVSSDGDDQHDAAGSTAAGETALTREAG